MSGKRGGGGSHRSNELLQQLSFGQVLGVEVNEQHLGLGDGRLGVHHVGTNLGNRDRRPFRLLAVLLLINLLLYTLNGNY